PPLWSHCSWRLTPLGRPVAHPARRGARRSWLQLVSGLFDGVLDRGLVEGGVARPGAAAGLQGDVDTGDTGDRADLLLDGADAVAAGHPGDGVGGGAHPLLLSSTPWGYLTRLMLP